MSTATVKEKDNTSKLVATGWATTVGTALVPPLVVIPLVLGAILAARGRVSTGVGMMGVALLLFFVRLYFWVA